MTNPERVDRAEIRRHLALITAPGQVIEVRAVGATSDRDCRQPHIIAGYFDDHEKLAAAVANYITRAEGIYVTLNEINEALLARACNRLVDRLRPTTGDADVLRRRIFYVDVDPIRPAQISATDAEHALALARVRQVSDYLQDMGAPAPLLADSGNGGHALWGIDLPADDGGLVQDALRALARRFSDALAKVDETVGNPARIGKLYGTWARKGDSMADRPHRLARILAAPERLAELPVAILEQLRSALPAAKPARRHAGTGQTLTERSFDLQAWVERHLPEAGEPSDWDTHTGKGRKWAIACPWNPEHTGRCAWVAELGNGAITAGCQHESCQGHDWHDLRALKEPGRRERRNGHTVTYSWRDDPPRVAQMAQPATEGAVEAERVPPPAAALASLPFADDELEPEPSAATEIEPRAATCAAPDEPAAPPTAAAVIARLAALRPDTEKPDRARVEAEAFELVAACVEFSKADLGRIASALRGLGCTQEFARNWQAAVREAKATHRGANAAATPDVVPYEADAGHLYHVRLRPTESGWEVERTVICDFNAEIAEEVTTEDGARFYIITGATADGSPFRLEIAAERFADERSLQAALDAAAGAYAPVRAKMAVHLRPAIKLLTRASQRVQHTRRFERTGWHAGRFLIPGREPADSAIVLDAKLAYRIPAEAELQQGLVALIDLVEALDPRRTTVALTGLFVGPLAEPAGWVSERFAQFIVGLTGSLKTSHLQNAMCMYGDFLRDERLLKWGEGATRNSLLKYAAKAHDLPLLLDNFKPNTGDGSRGFTNLVHNLIEGTDRDRLSRSAELRPPAVIRCWPTFTGEDVPADDPATIARLLVIRYEWAGQGANERLARAQAAAGHLPAVGGAWLAWLETAEGQRIARAAGAQFAATRAAWLRLLKAAEQQTPNAARIASNLALNQLTWWVLRQHPTIGPVLEPYTAQHEAGLAEVAADMVKRTRIAREAVRFLATIAELLISGRCVLAVKGARTNEPPDRVIGWRDPKTDTVYLLPDVAKREVLKVLGPDGLGILSDNALHEQIADMGLIASHDPERLTKVARVEPGGKTVRLLHLHARAVITTVAQPTRDPAQAAQIAGRLAELEAERSKLLEELEGLTGAAGEETTDA